MSIPSPSTIQLYATIFFALAVIHTFLISQFERMARRFREGSIGENFFHLLSEVEVVFGFWGAVFILTMSVLTTSQTAVLYLESLNFTEPAFVFCIMVVAATRPILELTEKFINYISALLPFERNFSFYLVALGIGPLVGSFITEPAAMTVIALLLKRRLFDQDISTQFKYATLGLLFVNISIGGTLTPYAAPPVVMVASKWNWDLMFMLQNFGIKTLLAVGTSTALTAIYFKKDLANLQVAQSSQAQSSPFWLVALHLVFLGLIVVSSHHLVVFVAVLLFFLGVAQVTKEYQDGIKIKEGLLVGFFLGGLVVLGTPQSWWLEPVLTSLQPTALYFGATGLTAITDNAALTYLGSQVPNLSDIAKYALVAGSVTGGGLTVIANAPNPAGFGILNSSFGASGIKPVDLFLGAIGPTFIAIIFFWLLPL